MDYESIKRLGLDHLNIDSEKSFETYNPSTNNHTIIIYLLKDENIICPLCGTVNDYTNKGSKSQFIKYSSALEDNITIKLFRKVYRCNSCNHYFKELNPLSESRKKISITKDYKILQELKNFNFTYKYIAYKFNVSTTYVIDLFDRKVDLNRLPLPKILCIDEVYSKKLSFHRYCLILYDPLNKDIVDVIDSRHLDRLEYYFNRIPLNERNNVHWFSIDLYDNYRALGKKCFRNAIICADSFHVIKNLSNFFHQIRIKIMKKYSHLKNQNNNYYWLFKKYWKLLTKDRSKISYKRFKAGKNNQYMTGREIIDYMLSIDIQLKLAYELLHEYRTFNEIATELNAAEWFDELVLKFKSSGIDEYIPAWKMLENWRQEILNSFIRFNGYRVSNGPMERVNRDIKTLFRQSFGSTNFKRMRNRIMFSKNLGAPILYNRKKETNKRNGKPRGSYKKNK